VRRPLLAVAFSLGALAATAQGASTAGSTVPESTAVLRGTTVTGAALLSMSYTTSGNTIVAVKPRLRGTGLLAGLGGLLPKTVTARMGSDLPVACVVTTSTLLNATTRLAEATYNCIGLLEPADKPRTLTITVS
jgi:hypothetical protein